jgi:hypothetical protein
MEKVKNFIEAIDSELMAKGRKTAKAINDAINGRYGELVAILKELGSEKPEKESKFIHKDCDKVTPYKIEILDMNKDNIVIFIPCIRRCESKRRKTWVVGWTTIWSVEIPE